MKEALITKGMFKGFRAEIIEVLSLMNPGRVSYPHTYKLRLPSGWILYITSAWVATRG